MRADIDRIILDRAVIAHRISELGQDITRDLAELGDDAEIVLVPVMTGAIIFVADLMRALPRKVRIQVVTASSYPGRATVSSGDPALGLLPERLDGLHAIIVDDILDSGRTLATLRVAVEARSPASVRACVLLRKPGRMEVPVPCEYVGFDIPDEFVVGYGLDFDGCYRNLPDIGILKRDVVESAP